MMKVYHALAVSSDGFQMSLHLYIIVKFIITEYL